MTETFDRSQLDGKDREQLSEIAAALGVKSVSRMRKAELVDAIVAATAGASDQRSRTARRAPRGRARSARPSSGGDDLASIADEQNALADAERARRRHGAHPPAPPRHGHDADSGHDRARRCARATERGARDGRAGSIATPRFASSDAAPAIDHDAGSDGDVRRTPTRRRRARRRDGEPNQPARDDDGQGNQRRRRRRGRDRDRPGAREPAPVAAA